MSVSPGMAAGQAGGYFSKEDYYLRDAEQGLNSRWCGEGAGALGLDGKVGEEEFRAACRGENPDGNRIVAPRLSRDPSGEFVETRRAGNDLTFSAPKSVSIAYAAGVDGIKEAHDAAVLSVLKQVEERYSLYHSPQGLLNGGMVAAKFDHATSRNIDPQLHSHVFLVNAALTPDGSFRANEPKAIYQDVKFLGLLYRHELARELRAGGFGLEIGDRAGMFFELKGVEHALIEHFSSRRIEIERQVALWQEEGKFAGVPHGKLYEMAALGTRDPKCAVTRDEVEHIFRRGFEECGSSMEGLRRELEQGRVLAPSIQGWEWRPQDSPERMVEIAAQELTRREAVLERARLLDQAVRISGGRHSLSELSDAIDGAGEAVVALGRDSRGREFYSTPEMLELEAGNLKKVRELAGAPFPAGGVEREIAAFKERLAAEGTRLTEGQWREFENEVAGSRGVALTVGDPGTAKTSTLGFIERFNEEVLRPQGRERFSINIACTGKATRELSLATGRPGFTVEGFQNAYAASKFDLQRQKTEPAIGEYGDEKRLIAERVPVVIRVDEASFLGAKQARGILEVVEELKDKGVPVKLHLLGDSKQMQAIQAGDFLNQVRELGERRELDFAHSTDILRQRDPELLKIAKGLNREDRLPSERAREALAALERRNGLTEITDLHALRKAAVEHYLEESGRLSPVPERAAAGERQSVLMVASSNAERRELNLQVRTARIAAGEIEEGRSFPVLAQVPQGVTVEGYRPGDTLVFSGVPGRDGKMHKWEARLGTEGRVTGIDREKDLVRVKYSFRTGKKERLVTREFPAAELEGKTTLFREEERQLSVGDRIVALKNDKRFKLQNGSLGTIKELDQDGRAVLDLGDRQVELDLNHYRHIDQAYAVTIHKSQSATVDHSIMVAPVRPVVERAKGAGIEPSPVDEAYGRASYNALNVAITRARFGTHVFTNSLEGLTRSVEQVDRNSSTLDKIPERKPELGQRLSGREIGEAQPLHKMEKEIDKLALSVRGPGEGIHKLNLEKIRLPELPQAARELHKLVTEIQVQKQLTKPLENPFIRGQNWS